MKPAPPLTLGDLREFTRDMPDSLGIGWIDGTENLPIGSRVAGGVALGVVTADDQADGGAWLLVGINPKDGEER
jgi:hypothetical protein